MRWEISATDDGALLVLFHRPLRPEPAVDYCAGWHAMLDSLDVHLDGGELGDIQPVYERLFRFYGLATGSSGDFRGS